MKILSQLPKLVTSRKKRKGRGAGSGTGAKSGRGTTRHQKARTKIPLHFEGGQIRAVKKYPLLRGKGKNKSIKPKSIVIDLQKLNILKSGQTVNQETLIQAGIINHSQKEREVKILGNGKIEKKLIIKLPISKKAKTMIEKAGGKVELK